MSAVNLSVDGAVATIVLNRPSVLNCLDMPLTEELDAALAQVSDTHGLRVVVVRGSGRAFCSGLDLTALCAGQTPERFFRRWEEVLRRIESLDAVVVAAVHSYCLGGGLQLALACDVRLARADARIGVTAGKEGLIPGLGMWRLARTVGVGRAKQLALAADVIDARTAHLWGLVQYVADEDSFDEELSALVGRLLAMGATSTCFSKRLSNVALDLSWSEMVELFCDYQRRALASEEHAQAMSHRRERIRR